MTESQDEQLVREATRIFMCLADDPDDQGYVAARDAFLARGDRERQVYADILRAWTATGKKPRPKTTYAFALLAVLGASLFLARGPLDVLWNADFTTHYEQAQVALASGDVADLDAGSAVKDSTSDQTRTVRLLQGAAFFDVDTDGRRFVVAAGEITAEALGTAFEVARVDDGVLVSVSEGVVEVRRGPQAWTLDAGERLQLGEGDAVRLDAVALDEVATWRADRLIADQLTFAQVADVIDRRLPGRVVIYDQDLATTTVSGGLDLSDPRLALEALAATEGASIVNVSPILTVIVPNR